MAEKPKDKRLEIAEEWHQKLKLLSVKKRVPMNSLTEKAIALLLESEEIAA